MITTLGCVRGVVGVLGVVGVVGVGGVVGVEDADATLHHIVNNALKRTPHTAIGELARS
jgi:hypothetical protein